MRLGGNIQDFFMKDKVKQIFLVTFTLFGILMWQNINGPNFYSSQESKEYQEYMGKKVSRILNKANEANNKLQSKTHQKPFRLRGLASQRGDCLGCCRDSGGVLCLHGRTYCKNGKELSEFCSQKGCNACPVLKGKNDN